MKVQHKFSLDKSAGELHNHLMLFFKQMVDEGCVALVLVGADGGGYTSSCTNKDVISPPSAMSRR